MSKPVPESAWKDVVEHSPLVSVDLIIEFEGGVLLGKRENQPAQGEWFIPGGVVRKNESPSSAVQRIAQEEIGSRVDILTQLGVYEHRYEVSEFDGVSKHYIPIAHVVTPVNSNLNPDTQHSELNVFKPPFSGFHEYVQEYLEDYMAWRS